MYPFIERVFNSAVSIDAFVIDAKVLLIFSKETLGHTKKSIDALFTETFVKDASVLVILSMPMVDTDKFLLF